MPRASTKREAEESLLISYYIGFYVFFSSALRGYSTTIYNCKFKLSYSKFGTEKYKVLVYHKNQTRIYNSKRTHTHAHSIKHNR